MHQSLFDATKDPVQIKFPIINGFILQLVSASLCWRHPRNVPRIRRRHCCYDWKRTRLRRRTLFPEWWRCCSCRCQLESKSRSGGNWDILLHLPPVCCQLCRFGELNNVLRTHTKPFGFDFFFVSHFWQQATIKVCWMMIGNGKEVRRICHNRLSETNLSILSQKLIELNSSTQH